MSVKTLDMAVMADGNTRQQMEFCKALLECLSNQGFVKIVGHGMENEVNEAFEWNERFFALPEEAKSAIKHPPRANPNRGWSAIGQEQSSAIQDFEKGEAPKKDVLDVKEAFDMGCPDDPLFANMWPDEKEIRGFRVFMESFYGRCHEVHLRLLRALERALSQRLIDVDLLARCIPNESELRFNYYPGIQLEELRTGKISRISEHTDFGTMTLLFQDAVGGLEIEHQDPAKKGEYYPVEARAKTEMVVNIGDSLQRLTNDYLTSASHRVHAPVGTHGQAEGTIDDRYSIAYFAKFDRDNSLRPLDPFVSKAHPRKYPEMTAFELNQAKLAKIYG